MQRLTGLDASFLYLETPSSHMHVAGLMILDPSSVEGGVDLEKVKEVYGARLHLAPPFRRRLAEVPFGLHHPLWIEDPDFDIDYHIRATALPAPGHQGAAVDARRPAVGHPARPQPPAVGGLGDRGPGGRQRRRAVQGPPRRHRRRVGQRDDRRPARPHPRDRASTSRRRSGCPTGVPSDVELLSYAASSLARQPVRVAKALGKTAGAAMAVRRRNRAEPNLTPPPSPFSAPRTSFNTAITPRRSFAFTTVSLPAVKAVKNAAGATVNDVVLAPVRRRAAALPRPAGRGARRPAGGDGAGVGALRGREGRHGQPGDARCSRRWPPTSTTRSSGSR